MEGPTVGRIVHYVAYGTPGGEYAAGAHRAAIITETKLDQSPIDGSVVNYCKLCIFNPTGMFFSDWLEMDISEKPSPGTWHWPERA